jgi:hypothetical protein
VLGITKRFFWQRLSPAWPERRVTRHTSSEVVDVPTRKDRGWRSSGLYECNSAFRPGIRHYFVRPVWPRWHVTCRSAVVGSAVFVPNWDRSSRHNYGLSVGAVLSAPSPLLLDPTQASCAVGSAVKKSSTRGLGWGSKTECQMCFVVSCAASENSPTTFFAQAAPLSGMRGCRDFKLP